MSSLVKQTLEASQLLHLLKRFQRDVKQDQVLTDVDLRSIRLEKNINAAQGQPDRETFTADPQSASPDGNDITDPSESPLSH